MKSQPNSRTITHCLFIFNGVREPQAVCQVAPAIAVAFFQLNFTPINKQIFPFREIEFQFPNRGDKTTPTSLYYPNKPTQARTHVSPVGISSIDRR